MYSLNVLYEGILSCSDVQQKTKSEQRHFHRLLERQQKGAPETSRHPLPGGTSLAQQTEERYGVRHLGRGAGRTPRHTHARAVRTD